MAYIVNADIEKRLPTQQIIELTDDEKTAGTLSDLATAIVNNSAIEDRISQAIEDADTLIDANIRKHYTVPVASPDNTIKKISSDLTVFNLYSRRGGQFELPEWVVVKRAESIRLLERINKGDADLGIDPPQPSSTKSIAAYHGAAQSFTADTLRDF